MSPHTLKCFSFSVAVSLIGIALWDAYVGLRVWSAVFVGGCLGAATMEIALFIWPFDQEQA